VEQPDILIFEGLNVLQIGAPLDGAPAAFTASDFFDLAIYIDAEIPDIARWYEDRFHLLSLTRFRDPHSFFHAIAHLPEKEVRAEGRRIWREVNERNLVENILPTRARADVVIRKAADHRVESVWLRRL
jgi:type I pantothenate kinase